MTQPAPPVLVPTPPDAARSLRRRTTLWSVAVGVLLLLALVAWGLVPGGRSQRPVVIVAPEGSRVSLDGRPVPTLGSEGTHLLRVDPGSHELELHLRNGQVISHELEVERSEEAIRLEVHYDRVYGRWSLRSADEP